MLFRKRAVGIQSDEDRVHEKTTQVSTNKKHKCWRRFMNERATDRAYVPTAYGKNQI